MSASEALRMVIKLEVDESLQNNYTKYQINHNNNNTNQTHINQQCTFPKQIKMFPWNDVQQITQYIYQQTQIPPENQRLFFRGQEITAYNKHKIKNNNKHNKLSSPTLSRLKITHESTIYLQCDAASQSSSPGPIVSYGYCLTDPDNKLLIRSCIEGLYSDLRPILSTDGEGGTYFLRDSHNIKTACFKPSDEEAGCYNNPRGRTDRHNAMHAGIKPGEGHLREIAAYLLDKNNNHFHCVPPTMRIECELSDGFHYNNKKENDMNNNNNNNNNNTKIGALQKFIHGEVIENFGVKNFAIREVHKIGILDIRILNCDRNSGNVLVSRDEIGGRYELIPIDHGLSLPEKIEITNDSWVWLNWDQSKQPFDPYTIEYINNIDINADISKLSQQLNLNIMTFENMRISHLTLVKCTNMGMTLNQIGSIIARPDFDTKSILEELMQQAEILACEKVRQNKHLINRIKLKKRRKSVNNTQSIQSIDVPIQRINNINIYNNNNNHTKDSIKKPAINNNPLHVDEGHIIHKFIEKGIPLKQPIFAANNNINGTKMCYVESLAPPNARVNNNNNKYQILNKNSSNMNNTMPMSSNSTNSVRMALSPTPSILNMSASLGAYANGMHMMSLTPEPKPFIVLVEKKRDDSNERERDIPKYDIHWTPTYSSITSQSSNTNIIRSVTPDRKQQNINYNHNHNNSMNNNIHRRSSPIPQLFLETGNLDKNSNDHNNDSLDNDESDDNEELIIHSPLQLEYMEKTLSIHDRDENIIVNDEQMQHNNSRMNTIFRTISGGNLHDDQSIKHIDMIDSVMDISNMVQNNQNNNDTINNTNNTTIKSKPFSSLNIDSLISNSNHKLTAANNNKNSNNNSNESTAEMVPLSRSTSCIDIRKTPKKSVNSFELHSIINMNNKNKTKNSLISNKKNEFKKLFRSKDEDSIFLYNGSGEIKSTSLINHKSMLDTRKEFLSLNSDDSNNNIMSNIIENNSNSNICGEEFNARSYSETILAPTAAINCKTNTNVNINNDSPSNSNISNTYSVATPHTHTPSNKSQDDNIAIIGKANVEFGIHPIMERMAKENHAVKKWFWYYLDQLLGIQCERISKRSRKNDKFNDIYDIDTVNGSFIWKNELRIHWIRSRLERKKLMQPLPPTNPFEHIQFDDAKQNKQNQNNKNKKVVLQLTDNKTSPIIANRSNQNKINVSVFDHHIEKNNQNETINANTHPNSIDMASTHAIKSNFLDLEHLEDDEYDSNNDNWFGAVTKCDVSDESNDAYDAYELYNDESI